MRNEDLIYEDLNCEDSCLDNLDRIGPWQMRKEKDFHQQSLSTKNSTKPINVMMRSKGRKLSVEQNTEKPLFIQKQVYDQQRSIQKIITDYFKEHQQRPKTRGVGFFMNKEPKRTVSKVNSSTFQSSQVYFEKIALKLYNNLPKQEPRPASQKAQGYLRPVMNLYGNRKTKSIVTQAQDNESVAYGCGGYRFLTRTGRLGFWKQSL
ncbi:hypothetical protein pb186bvf_006513 [Paramecium bursaria]